MIKTVKDGHYYKAARNYEGIKKGRIYKLESSFSRSYPGGEPTGDTFDQFVFVDKETGQTVELINPPSDIFEEEYKEQQ